jgi:hypothetical protein
MQGRSVTLTPVLDRLYLANASVLLVHQMDAAYWNEWTLFALPGGLALYLVLNVPIALALLLGYGAVAARRPSAVGYSWLLVASGLFAAGFHAVHLWRGDPAFRAPVSLALLADTLLLSVLQAGLLVRLHRGRAGQPVRAA